MYCLSRRRKLHDSYFHCLVFQLINSIIGLIHTLISTPFSAAIFLANGLAETLPSAFGAAALVVGAAAGVEAAAFGGCS